jgi:hypothetical protein
MGVNDRAGTAQSGKEIADRRVVRAGLGLPATAAAVD